MGVPKFYRWISERYPNIGGIINDYQIPDFDNFYLDMNGIIHTCSHINEDNCEINVTEEEIFRNIFYYLDFLFRMIKPKKVFFMAIDGVAPRAKMNQQRARRFRAGRDRTKKLQSLAEKSGRSFKETAANHFDTNSITPGTKFMVNLHEQLKYFIHIKLTTDPLWENVDIHLSGHLTPGEGEHKIMDYIRYIRSQPGYDMNTKHCLYGLDADLIMLGLVTHEMHFTLLREEVKYGSKKINKILSPEEITWHLLHTCLLRDYIDLEFRSLRNKLKFPYNLENIIDDWILMGYLVGNDFIPHLPHFHINEEALTILWDTYKKILPTLDGYMNENGELNLPRFEIYLTELAKFDHQRYANDNDSFRHLDKLNKSKKGSFKNKSHSDSSGFDLAVLDKLTNISTNENQNSNNEKLDKIILNAQVSSDLSSLSDDNDPSSDSDTLSAKSNNDDDDDDDKKETSSVKPKVINKDDINKMPLIEAEFRQHKNHYYREKMKINLTSTDQLQIYVDQYIEALQWILKYYYQGCQSWSWFYPHHYAPYLSDLKNFKNLNIIFNKGIPFKPFEQLLSVLPPTSSDLLPIELQPLMNDPASPLLHFYPENFELDQNEKKKDWEAIVLLPFIDEELLLNTITQHYNKLDSNEQNRNQQYPSLCFRTTSKLQPIENSLQNNPYFPSLKETRASFKEFSIDYYQLENQQIKYGRFQDKDMVYFPKFPILNVLPYKYDYKTNAVNLFESRSQAATLVLSLTYRPDSDCIKYNDEWNPKNDKSSLPFQITNQRLLIERYLGKCVFVNWPHFQYGIVCAISDYRHLHIWSNIPGGSAFYFEPINNDNKLDYKNFIQTPLNVSNSAFEISIDNNNNKPVACVSLPANEIQTQMEYTKALNINRNYGNRQGISIGPIPILLYVSPLIGYRTKCSSSSDKCRTTMCFSNQALAYPLQTTLFKLPNYKYDFDKIPQTIHDYFKINDSIFGLQQPYYSSIGHVEKVNKDNHGKYSVLCQMESSELVHQPDIHQIAPKLNKYQLKYFTAQEIGDRLNILPCVISKITGKVNVIGKTNRRRKANPTNIGLLWKSNKPVKQLHGYTRKMDEVWYYSDAAIIIISDYVSRFPEIINEIQKKPRDDNYFESNIWPDKDGKHELQKVRIWIKSLPTYSMSLADSSWQILDEPIVNEIEKNVKTFYTKQLAKNSPKTIKTIPLDPHNLFKPNESFGMCNPDASTIFYIYDRVVNVSSATGIPIGTRGTIIGITFGRTNLDIYYEVLFDNLPSNSLHVILLGKNQQRCRIKVRSYHLLNYSHSLRLRSMNSHQRRSITSNNISEPYSHEQISSFRQQQQSARTFKKDSNDNNTVPKPKSAPPLSTRDKPDFIKNNEQESIINNLSSTEIPTQPGISMENPSLITSHVENLSDSKIIPPPPPMNVNIPAETHSTSSTLNSSADPFFLRAIQDFEPVENALQQSSEINASIPSQPFNPGMSFQQQWSYPPYQYVQPPLTTESTEYMSQMPPYPFEQQFPAYMPFGSQQPANYYPFSSFNPMGQGPPQFYDLNGQSFLPIYDIPPENPYPDYTIQPMATSMPINYAQQQQQQQALPMQMQNISMGSGQSTTTSHIPSQSSPLQPQQMTSAPPINRATLQFIPSQVFRNRPKKS